MKKIGIIAALPQEIEILRENLQGCKVVNLAGTEAYSGQIGNYEVLIAEAGMGKVCAAASAQALITKFSPDYIINTGCAGALKKGLNVGDMVISDATVEWDLDLIAIGLERGFVSSIGKVRMEADKWLCEELNKVIDDKVTTGLIVSGDEFVSTKEQKDIIFNSFPDALCAEMEGAAVGHVCMQNQVPFCVIRCMSDTADHDSGVNFSEFMPVAGKKSAEYILKFLKGSM